MTTRLKRLAWLLLLAALLLPGLLFEPHAQHTFWATELLTTRLLVPLAFLAAWSWGGEASSASSLALAGGAKLLYGLMGLWLLSALCNSGRWDLGLGELSQWLAYPLVFAATWRLADSARLRHKLVALLLLGGVLQALYGLLQTAGQDPFPWATLFGGRAGGFLGNPNFLGGQLALLLPVALATGLACAGAGVWKKTMAWGAAALILAGLIATQTRGAWIGAALGCGLTLTIASRRLPGLLRQQRLALGTLTGAAVALGLAFALAHPGSLQRLSGAFSGDEELAKRGVLMRAAGDMAVAHPLLGVGPGQFRIYFPTVQATGLGPQDLGPQGLASRPYISSEHAHNDLLQMAAEAGLPAAILYGLLLLWLYKKLGKGSGQAGGETLLVCGVMGGLAALHVHGLANFPFLIAPTQLTAWAMAALGLRAGWLPSDSENSQTKPGHSRIKVAALLALLLGAVAGAYFAERVFTQDMLWWVGQGESKQGNFSVGEPKLSKALGLYASEDRLWYQRGLTQLGLNNIPNAAHSFQEAVRLNPHFTEARYELGKALLGLGQTAEAEAVLQAAVADAPNMGDLDEPLGAARFLQKDFRGAVQAYDHAINLNFKPVTMLGNKAAALGNLGDLDGALQALQAAQARDPLDASVQINLAITYFKMGQKPLARQALQRARSLDPSNPQLGKLSQVIR